MSRGFPVEEVPLAAIWEIDSAYWFSHELPTVRSVVDHARLIEEVDSSHPIILGSDGRVMDGMHRVARALLEGRSSIRGVRFPEIPEPDYVDCRPEDLLYD